MAVQSRQGRPHVSPPQDSCRTLSNGLRRSNAHHYLLSDATNIKYSSSTLDNLSDKDSGQLIVR